MEAEILQKRPLSGDYEEHDFSDSGNTVWIKFFDEEWREWCGIFSLSYRNQISVHKVPDEPVFLVMAGGQGYYVNVNTRKVIEKTAWDNIEAIIYNEEEKLFIISDGLCIGILKDNTLIWSSERISFSGIAFLNSSGSVIKGRLNDLSDDGCAFEFDVVSKHIESSWLFYAEFE